MTARALAGQQCAEGRGSDVRGKSGQAARSLVCLALCLAFLTQVTVPTAGFAAKKQKPAPTGTLLIPITPKIDTSKPSDTPSVAATPAPKLASKPVTTPPTNPLLLQPEQPQVDKQSTDSPRAAKPQEEVVPGGVEQDDDISPSDPNAGIDIDSTPRGMETGTVKPPTEKITAESGSPD